MLDERALLRTVIHRYVHEVRGLSMAALRRRQIAPWSNIGHGAGGIAYAMWRLSRTPRRRALVGEAHRWWRAASAPARRAGAFSSTGELRVPRAMTASSLSDGPAGLAYLGALIAHARGESAAPELTRFARACRPRAARAPELLHGSAGLLVGALTLHRVTGAAAMRAIADRLAGELLADPRAVANGLPSFAHGGAGVLSALFQWSASTGAALPAHVFDALAPLDPQLCAALPPILRLSWCNGLAGHAIVFAHAYRCSGDRAHLARAREAAQLMDAAADGAIGNLCCGLGGAAYALRTLDRAAGSRAHARRARTYATLAISRMQSSWPNGLLRGWPGIVCLAADVLRDADDERDAPGFPIAEA